MNHETLTLHRRGTDHSADIQLESVERLTRYQQLGLMPTATGYGKRIPTAHMVCYMGKWRRVYCFIYSNAGTCYIGKMSDGMFIS